MAKPDNAVSKFSITALAAGIAATSAFTGAATSFAEDTAPAANDSQVKPAKDGHEARELVKADTKAQQAAETEAKAQKAADDATAAEQAAAKEAKAAKQAAVDSVNEAKKSTEADAVAAETAAAEADKAKETADADAAKADENVTSATTAKEDADKALADAPAPDQAAFDKAKQDAAQAKAGLDEATSAKTKADADAEAAQQDLISANATKVQADEAVQRATTASKEAAEAQDKAEQAVKEAQAKVDATSGESDEIVQRAEAALDTAKNELKTAQAKKTAADNTLAAAEVKAKETAASAAEKQQTAERANVLKQAAEKALGEAQQDKEAAEIAAEAAQQKLKKAKENQQQAEAAVNAAQEQINSAKDKVEKATTAKTQADANVTAAEQALADAKKEAGPGHTFEEGSRGFFESVGATDAVKILDSDTYGPDTIGKNGPYATHVLGIKDAPVNVAKYLNENNQWVDNPVYNKTFTGYNRSNAETSATNLDNMKNTLDWIAEGNRLRALHGLPALKISHSLMAVAQSNLNLSIQLEKAKSFTPHSSQHDVGENIASASASGPLRLETFNPYGDEDIDKSPTHNPSWYKGPGYLNGWYWGEKRNLEENNGFQTGHYLTLVDRNGEDKKHNREGIKFVATGFAGAKDGAGPYQYGLTMTQVFASESTTGMWGLEGGDILYTLKEYKEIFDKYYNAVKSGNASTTDPAVVKAQQDLDAARQTAKQAQQELENANAELTNANKTFTEALNAKTQKAAAVAAAQEEANTKAQALQSAITDLASKTNDAKVTAEQAARLNDEAKTAKQLADSAKQAETEERAKVAELAVEVANKQAIVEQKQKDLEAAVSGTAAAQAVAELKKANADLEAKKAEKTDADVKLAAAQAKAETTSAAAQEAQTKLDEANTAKQAAEENLTKATEADKKAQETLKPFAEQETKHQQAKDAADKAAANLEKASTAKRAADDAAAKAADKASEAGTTAKAKRALADKVAAVDPAVGLTEQQAADEDLAKFAEKFDAAKAAAQIYAEKTVATNNARSDLDIAAEKAASAKAVADKAKDAWLAASSFTATPDSGYAGVAIDVTGYGFLPGEKVLLEFHSAPVALGETVADATGSISETVVVPADAAAGAHTVVATGQTSGLVLNANVSVLAAQKTEQNQGKNNAQGPKRAVNAKKAARGLPTTGSAGSLPLTELALLGLVAPAIAVAIRRRDN